MCDACDDADLHDLEAILDGGKRKRLWELAGGWHCSVLGTCLGLSDLRALARKLPLKTRADFPIDYQLHGFFVKEAGTPGRAAKLLGKLLDKRHATAIRRARAMKTVAELTAFWTEALEAGDVPGPYWAILTHPAASEALCERLFADVHMLSHLVGASNRADIRRLQALEDEIADLREKLSLEQRRHRQRLGAKDKTIADLRAKLRKCADSPVSQPRPPKDEAGACVSIPALRGELTRVAAEQARAEQALRDQQGRNAALLGMIESLQAENAALEQALMQNQCPAEDDCPLDLGGRCLLYVGGRPQAVARLRSLIEGWNGRLLHHDGGLEKSMGELAGAVVRADAVLFPTDCVSHDAANTVKRLCRQSMKPYVPLRSSGIASLVAGLRQGLNTAGLDGLVHANAAE